MIIGGGGQAHHLPDDERLFASAPANADPRGTLVLYGLFSPYFNQILLQHFAGNYIRIKLLRVEEIASTRWNVNNMVHESDSRVVECC